MRLRHGAARFPREAAADAHLATAPGRRERLQAARLYFVTPDEPPARILELALAALGGGADIVQLRHKSLDRAELLALARRLRAAAPDAVLIVNDQVDLAWLSRADGVHLGQADLAVASARKILGHDMLIGASASSPAAARAAVGAGADYIGCGAAFATPTKSDKPVIGPAGVAAVAAAVPGTPVFAIGGIDESNLAQLTTAGVHRVCVIRAIAAAADPASATRRLRAMLTM